MCVVCQNKEVVKFQERAVEALALSLGEMVQLVRAYCPLAVESERLALARADSLLNDGLDEGIGEPEEASQDAPRGIPEPVWDALPVEFRALLLAAQELGGIVRAVPLDDMLAELETKH